MIEKSKPFQIEIHTEEERSKESHIATMFVVGISTNRAIICVDHTENDNQAVVFHGHKFINDMIENSENLVGGILGCIISLRHSLGRPTLSPEECKNLFVRSRSIAEADILPDYDDKELRKWII